MNEIRFDGNVNTLSIERLDRHRGLNPHVLQIVEAIVDHSNTMPVVPAETVKKAFFSKKFTDDEIESLDITLPLKCPLTLIRLKTPVRGLSCKHFSCFDSSSISILSNNARFIRCPNCNRDFTEAELVIDGFVQEILNNTDENVDEVTIDSNTGEWRIKPCGKEALESSGDEQSTLKIPRINEVLFQDDLYVPPIAPPGTSIVNAIVLD
jgi:hypothetical protein